MNVVQVKRLLRILNGQYDSYIAEILPMVLSFVETECNRTFPLNEDGSPQLPNDLQLFVAKAIEYNLGNSALQSEGFAEQSVSFNNDYPPAMMRVLRNYRVVRFV